MVARQNFILPDVIDPPRRCIQIDIPDNEGHILAFVGAIKQLTDWFNWQRDEDKLGTQVAKVWEDVFLSIDWSDMSCCPPQSIPIIRRIDPEDPVNIQISYDGGDTYITDPVQIWNTIMPLPPPVIDGTHTKCDAASNALQHIKDAIAAQIASLEVGGTIAVIATALVVFLIGAFLAIITEGFALPAEVGLFYDVIAAISALGVVAFTDYWTSDNYDIILCALFCHIQEDGTFTQGGFDGFIGDITTGLPDSAAKDWLIQVMSVGKLAGLNNFAAYGVSADADCSSCSCGCDCIEFTVITGTLVGSGVDDDGNCFIIASSEPHGGGAHETVTVVFNNTGTPDSNCAAYVTAEVLIGTPDIFSQFFLDCGGAGSYHTIVGNPCMSAYDVESDSGFPYTMKLTVNAGSDCGCL